jgi:alpha-D-xyloside xylohydrolase
MSQVPEAVLTWRRGGQQLRVEPWGPGAIRVRASAGPLIRDDLPGCLLPATACMASVRAQGGTLQLVVDGLVCSLETASGRLRFHDAAGKLLCEEVPGNTEYPFVWPLARDFTHQGGELFRVEARFSAQPEERFHGLGQHRHGLWNQRGAVIDLFQRNGEVCIPLLISDRGYGLLWHNPGVGRVELATTGTRWVADAAHQLDYLVFAGDPAQVLARYADATGHPSEFPAWAAGFWQCKLRYRSQDELLGVAREHIRRGHPLAVIVADFMHWRYQGDFDWNRAQWPDPAAMCAELKGMGVELMASVWPTANPRSPNWQELRDQGLLVRTERGLEMIHHFSDTLDFPHRVDLAYLDATDPRARAWMWEKLKANYLAHGCRVYWLDTCEPEMYHYHFDNIRFHLGHGQAVASMYPLCHQQGVYEGLRASGEAAPLTLCRSAWAGSQRYGAAVWSGDIPSTWQMFRATVRAGLNVAFSGLPWWTTDIGGFSHGRNDDPAFRELLVRWFQYGAFCPLFRLHGNREPGVPGEICGGPNEVWSWGPEVEAILGTYLKLRERLRPYVMAAMREASRSGLPPMRPLALAFPGQRQAWDCDDQFLLGPDLLVAPVYEPGARTRHVWLPAGANWTEAWTGTVHQGGRDITVEAPLERIPLFLRDGATLPILEGS